jgi:hypothetical protein
MAFLGGSLTTASTPVPQFPRTGLVLLGSVDDGVWEVFPRFGYGRSRLHGDAQGIGTYA